MATTISRKTLCFEHLDRDSNLDQFREDAADGPDVDLGPVLSVADQQLRGPVPPRGHVVGEVVAGS